MGAKKTPISKIKQFVAPYRKENFERHLVGEHPVKWATYQSLGEEERAEFFDSAVPFVNTLHAHADRTVKSFEFIFDASIIDKLVSEYLWKKGIDGELNETRENALRVFKKVVERADDEDCDAGVAYTQYKVKIASEISFNLITDYVGIGMSLKQATRALEVTKERTRDKRMGFPSQLQTQSFVRVASAITFQVLANLMPQLWAFSIGTDASTCLGTSYLDLRVRFVWLGRLYNLHVIALPMSGSHTGIYQYQCVVNVLDVLCPNWKTSLICATTDGARDMTGRIQGLVTRIGQVVSPGFLRVWCLLHQLDILMRKQYHSLYGGEYWSTMIKSVSHLRRQYKLIDVMGATCPLLRDTRWESMHGVSYFMDDRRAEITEHYNDLPAAAPAKADEPTPTWWIINSAVSSLTLTIKNLTRSMQGKGTLLSQQGEAVERVRAELMVEIGIEVIEDPAAALLDNDKIQNGRFSVSKTNVVEHIEGLSFFCIQRFSELDEEDQSIIVECVGSLFMEVVEGMGQIVALRDDTNSASDQAIPPALPHEFAQLSARDLFQMVLLMKERLLAAPGWTETRLDDVCKQHKTLLAEAKQEIVAKALKECGEENCSFTDAWAIPCLDGKYKDLLEFAGGFASIFPNTSTIEADFSHLKYEKDIWRKCLSDLTLQGILHCQQFPLMQSIPV